MKTVFISGSIKIRTLKADFVDRLANIASSDDLRVIVGDANGADKSVQNALKDRGAECVEIYCTGDQPRNNIGGWATRKISSDAPRGTREYYTAKDRAMAEIADFGLMAWDGKSTGTLSNVLELLRRGKYSVVFIHKAGQFVTIKKTDDIEDLLTIMTDDARREADQKIGLSATVRSFGQSEMVI